MTKEEALAFQKRLQKDYAFFLEQCEPAAREEWVEQLCLPSANPPPTPHKETEREEAPDAG